MSDQIKKGVIGIEYTETIKLVGVGFKVELKKKIEVGNLLCFSVGFSHPIHMTVPKIISVSIKSPTELSLKSFNLYELGQFAKSICSIRKPEPYTGRGLWLIKDNIQKKAGKKRALFLIL